MLRGKSGPLSALALTVCLSAAVTLAAVFVPPVHLAYHAPSLRVALETASALIGLLVALLVYGRARRSRRPDEFVLALGLVWLAASNLLLAAIVAFIPRLDQARPAVFAGAVVGSGLIALAATAPPSALAWRQFGRYVPVAAVALTVGLTFMLAHERGHRTPPRDALRPHPSSNPWLLAMQVIAMIAFGIAAYAFARRAIRTSDTFLGWVAAAMGLACFSRLNYVLFPPILPQWVYLGDGFRMACHSVLLIAAIREIRGYWQRIAETAVLDERRRLAREIHDSIAQELAYIGRRASQLETANGVGAEIAAAAQRGLVESRRAITTLSQGEEPFEHELRQVLDVIAAREGVTVELHAERPMRICAEERATLLGIAREAVSNAARHGRAEVIHVELVDGRHPRLRVADDGAGFDPAEAMSRGSGFGLGSMKELALALGAEFRITSRPGLGTEVEVVLS